MCSFPKKAVFVGLSSTEFRGQRGSLLLANAAMHPTGPLGLFALDARSE